MKRTHIITAMLVFAVTLGWLLAQSKSTDPMVASAKLATVDTVSGKLQGFVHNGTYANRGIPYAKAERFMPPGKVPKWEGVRTALTYAISFRRLCPTRSTTSWNSLDLIAIGSRMTIARA
jgi:para-nitrobenzyl esterase